ncbi:alginate O-acetyltransferase [Pseudomonas capeferrum]|nr:alginate O-acetyltransferase [Pseudomonas capeferrum]MBA1202845.1 alginate O-acetyltransferase [Pseudomonas capeferrum]
MGKRRSEINTLGMPSMMTFSLLDSEIEFFNLI